MLAGRNHAVKARPLQPDAFLEGIGGLRVPDDVSVVGFDDFRLISEALDPGLTTVALPYREMGELAARRAFAGDALADTVRVPCVAVERGTVTSPAKGKR